MSLRANRMADFYVRGSEIWHHKVGMFIKATGWVSMAGVSAFTAVIYAWLFVFFDSTDRAIFFYNRIAAIETAAGFGNSRWFLRRLTIQGVDAATLTPAAMLDVTAQAYASRFGFVTVVAVLCGLAAAYFAGRYVTRFYASYGEEKGEREHLRGTSLVDRQKLTELVSEAEYGLSQYRLAGVPLPKAALMRNILSIGAMGVGKSQLMFDLADQVLLKNGRKSIIWDKSGDFTQLYYRPGRDVILNPFDQRYPGWNIFSEIKMGYEFEQVAHSLCPEPENQSGNSKYFTAGARIVIASILRRLWEENRRTTADAVSTLMSLTPGELAEFLRGTDASMFISTDAAEQALGVLSTLIESVQFLKHVPDGKFSIKEWVLRDDDSRLFITSHETAHDVLRPLVAAYLDIAIRATMARDKTHVDRLWIWLDELASLGNVPILKISLTEARKYGVVHVVGLHNISQLRQIYGADSAQTLRSNLQNYVVCRVADEESQEAFSKLLGTAEWDEQSEGLSFGVAASRDGSSLQLSRKEARIVLPSEIKMLPDNVGYMQIAGAYPIARVDWLKVDREAKEPAYLVRDDLILTNQDARRNESKAVEAVGDDIDSLIVRF